MFKRYVASKRHTMQVDFDDYLRGARQGAQARRASARARRATGCRCRRARRARGRRVTAPRRRAARGDEGGQPRGDPRRGARRVRRARLRRGERARHRAPHRPRRGHVLQLLPRQGGGLPRARGRGRRRGAPARARRPAGGARRPRAFVEDGYRAYFAFIVEDPAASRSCAATRARSARCSRSRGPGRASTSWPRTCGPRSPPGWSRRSTSSYCAASMVAVALELGQRLAEGAPDVEAATRFATELFLGGVVRASSS